MRKARAKFPTTTRMNKTEARYAREILEVRLRGQDILWYRFEALKLQLGDGLTYTPDFIVVGNDGGIECHECKAVWSTGKAGFRDDARAKIKIAAQLFPFFTFIVAAHQSASRRSGRVPGWQFELIESRGDELPKMETPPGTHSDGVSRKPISQLSLPNGD